MSLSARKSRTGALLFLTKEAGHPETSLPNFLRLKQEKASLQLSAKSIQGTVEYTDDHKFFQKKWVF